MKPVTVPSRFSRPEIGAKVPGNVLQVVRAKQPLPKITVPVFTLSNQGVWKREYSKEPVNPPMWMKAIYHTVCWSLDEIYVGRPIDRFWMLETLARMPYFSYVSVIHLYETLGLWSLDSDLKALHLYEEANECFHLQIMESIGGGQRWSDQFLARHAAILYFLALILLFLFSPKDAYKSSELLESHAVCTYEQFIEENEVLLKTLPVPPCVYSFYSSPSRIMYDTFIRSDTRIPENLFDVFQNIRDDENAHQRAMEELIS